MVNGKMDLLIVLFQSNDHLKHFTMLATLLHAAQLSSGEPGFKPPTFRSLDDPLYPPELQPPHSDSEHG